MIEFSARSKSLGSDYSWSTYKFFSGRKKAAFNLESPFTLSRNPKSYHLTSLKASSNPEMDPSSTWSGTQ